MSQNQQEQSEAKLLAYIEGELDPADRVEIERHLETNPQHRRMLSDLMRARDLVRWLPRAPAPADLYEGFQAQLERSALLDDAAPSAVDDGSTMKLNRWTQLRSAAAVAFLAAGVGAAVYFALPHQNSGQVVLAPPSSGVRDRDDAAEPTTRDARDAARPDVDRPTEARREHPVDGLAARGLSTEKSDAPATMPGLAPSLTVVERAAEPVAAAPAGPGVAGVAQVGAFAAAQKSGPSDAAGSRDAADLRVEQAMAQTFRTAEQLPGVQVAVGNGSANVSSGANAVARDKSAVGGGGGGGGLSNTTRNAVASADGNNGTVYVVVAASDPDTTSQQITKYLTSNSIHWDNVDRDVLQNGAYGVNGTYEAAAGNNAATANDPGVANASNAADAANDVARRARADAPAPQPALARGAAGPAGQASKMPAAAVPTAAAAAGESVAMDAAAVKDERLRAAATGAGRRMADAAAAAPPPATRPAVDPLGGLAPDRAASARGVGGSPVAQQPAPPSLEAQAATQPAGINNLIIARRMTRGQANELRGNFHHPAASQWAQVYEADAAQAAQQPAEGAPARPAAAGEPNAAVAAAVPAPSQAWNMKPAEAKQSEPPPAAVTAAPARATANGQVAAAPSAPAAPAPATPPAAAPVPVAPAMAAKPASDAPIRVGDLLEVVTRDRQSPAGAVAHTVKVAVDGTVTVPALGAITCAGLTPREAEKAWSEGLALKRSAGAVTVSVQRVTATARAANAARELAKAQPTGVTPPPAPAVAAPVAREPGHKAESVGAKVSAPTTPAATPVAVAAAPGPTASAPPAAMPAPATAAPSSPAAAAAPVPPPTTSPSQTDVVAQADPGGPVDVVIVVQRAERAESPAAAGAAATTQPAGAVAPPDVRQSK